MIAVLYLLRQYSNKTDDLLRWLCEDFLQMPPGTFRDAQVLRTEHGKPYLPDLPVEVSVSHTGRLFAALIAEEGVGPVGLDVQSMRTASYEKIARRFFKEEEYDYILQYGKNGFYRLWTRKEALTKYRGLPLLETAGRISLVDAEGIVNELDEVTFTELHPETDIMAAAVWQADRMVELCSKEMNEKLF
ncbi:MAG: 4'-phosphopantetheinyl transferase superfamily protein [Firmicutes bacterium]|nr:4'-phosphopantetheinyl transferase superfamily protein [Bacillota bacterium]